MGDLAVVVALFTPLLLGLAVDGLSIRFGWLAALAVPIDRGAHLRGRPLFGANKTYRGIVAVALGAAGAYLLQSAWPALQPPALRSFTMPEVVLFGAAMGAAAMLSELPNSMLKRQAGVSAGAPARGVLGPIFYILDQVDFLLGTWVVAWPWVCPTPGRLVWSMLFMFVAHQLVSFVGYLLGLRASPR